RMAEANRYNASSVCQSEGGFMVQNIGLKFTPQLTGCLGDLLVWADGHLLLLLFGPLSGQALKQLRQLSATGFVRVVQVLSPAQKAQAVEHVTDTDGRLKHACGDANARWALLRPDAYLVARGTALNGHMVRSVAKAFALA
ncbi:MAG: FAD-binding monooxygenase, partial [Betaproteobacteria bacterium]|nr:FAD-binding monooxygenase [Betaproteobacteria bacterium]